MANNENLIPIPGRLHSVATEGHVAGADEIIDDNLSKDQQTINAEVNAALGEGGTVDEKIAEAIDDALEDAAFIDDSESSPAVVPGFDPTTDTVHVTAQTLSESQKAQVRTNIGLGDVDARISNAVASEASQRAAAVSGVQSSVNAEVSRATSAENTINQKLQLLNGCEVIVVTDHTQVSSPDSQKIYREIGTSSYTDWMYQDSAWKQIATYNPGIDDEPTAGSHNLVTSGGVFDGLKSLDCDINGVSFVSGYIDSSGNLAPATDTWSMYSSEMLPASIINGMIVTFDDSNYMFRLAYYNGNTFVSRSDIYEHSPVTISTIYNVRITLMAHTGHIETLDNIIDGFTFPGLNLRGLGERIRTLETNIDDISEDVDSLDNTINGIPQWSSGNIDSSGNITPSVASNYYSQILDNKYIDGLTIKCEVGHWANLAYYNNGVFVGRHGVIASNDGDVTISTNYDARLLISLVAGGSNTKTAEEVLEGITYSGFEINGLEKEFKDLYGSLINLQNNIVIPPYFFAAVNLQKTIYLDDFGLPVGLDSSIKNSDNNLASWEKPVQRGNRITVTSASEYPIYLKSYFCGKKIVEKASIVKGMTRNNPATAKNILWVGDSISDYKNSAKFCRALFDEINSGISPSFVGTKHTSGTPDESYAGYDMRWFVTNTPTAGMPPLDSPFIFNSALNFTAYNTALGISKIDVCVIELGYNDIQQVANGVYTISDLIGYYKDFIDGIIAANTGIKIVLVLSPQESAYWNGRFVKQYKRDWVNKMRSIQMGLANDYPNTIVISDAMYCLDDIYGYYSNTETDGLADVYSSLGIDERRCTDSTHPSELGCKEWAQNVYPAILYAFSL